MNISRGLNLSCVDEKNTLKNIISTRQHLKLKYCFSLGLRGLFLASRLQNASKHLRFFLASFCFSFFRFLFPRWMSTWMGLAIWLCRGTLSGRRILYKFESISQSIWDIFFFSFYPLLRTCHTFFIIITDIRAVKNTSLESTLSWFHKTYRKF